MKAILIKLVFMVTNEKFVTVFIIFYNFKNNKLYFCCNIFFYYLIIEFNKILLKNNNLLQLQV